MDEREISIAGLSKARILAALYNGSRVQGMGFLHARSGVMTEEQAQKEIDEIVAFNARFPNPLRKKQIYFDYLHGRVMKIDLSSDVLFVGLYDRDNGEGAAKRIIDRLRSEDREGA